MLGMLGMLNGEEECVQFNYKYVRITKEFNINHYIGGAIVNVGANNVTNSSVIWGGG